MTDFQIAIMLMCAMALAYAWFTKLLFEAFIVHLQRQSDLTSKAVEQAGSAIALNGRVLETLAALTSQDGGDRG